MLPHRGGGGETYVDLLDGLDGAVGERFALSAGRTPRSAAASLPLCWPALMRAARRADLLHVHGDAAALLTLPLLLARPAVWTTHGLHLLRRRPSVAPGVRAAIAATRVTLCTSRTEHEELAALVPGRRERLAVVRNGVAPAPPVDPAVRAAARGELSLGQDEVAVLFLGELEERKRPLDAVAAVAQGRRDGAPLVLLVAGEGPLREQLARRAGGGVRVLGFRDDVERLLAAADVFVLPSTREGLSFALLEAMRAGLALIVADGAGNAEAVGDAGVVVPAGDRDALAAALTGLASDAAERARLGGAARARVAREFSVEQLRSGVADAYARALRAPARAAGAGSA